MESALVRFDFKSFMRKKLYHSLSLNLLLLSHSYFLFSFFSLNKGKHTPTLKAISSWSKQLIHFNTNEYLR